MPTTTHEILLFASLRERAGTDRLRVAVDDGGTVGDLVAAVARAHPELGDLLGPCRVAVDHVFVAAADPLGHPGEIALVPPVSGGHDGRYVVTEHPLSLATVVAAVEHAGAGGIATFIGNVRGQSQGKTIEHLDYEAYVPMAEATMATIAAEIEARVVGSRVAIHHRIGRLAIGESAVIIAASAPHRAEAFTACRDAIEALKRDVPIWKREHATDGTSWYGRGP
jgi:molybdopterin converting factor subunit 1